MGFRSLIASGSALALAAAATNIAAEPRLEIEVPVVEARAGRAFVSGSVLTGVDLILAIDTSDSTDVPLDEGSVLEAEVRLAERLLERLDPATTRVGLVTFASDWHADTPDSVTRVALTSDFGAVRRALAEIPRRGTQGLTALGAGLDRALVELLGTASATGRAREGVHRAVLSVSDGRDGEAPLARSAERAGRAGVRVHSVVVGEEATRRPGALGAASASALAGVVDALDFSEVAWIRVRNRTLEQEASRVERRPDGHFASLVRLREGVNRLEVAAGTTDGLQATRTLEVRYAPARRALAIEVESSPSLD